MKEVETENSGTGAAVTQVVKLLVGFDRPFFTALAIALGIFATMYAWVISNEVVRMEYWLGRNEAFLEQLSNQGVKVPSDLLRKERN